MPEGPEIKRSTDQLSRVLQGQVVQKVLFDQPHLSIWQRRLGQRKVLGVEPRGKAVLTHFERGHTIYSHNQLYGEWAVFDAGAEPQSHKLRRIVLDTERHRVVLYSASDIEVLMTEQVAAHPYIAKLGVELLDAKVNLARVCATVNLPKWQKRALAALLLDQGFLAGIGNYLRSEILYVAKLYPWVRLGDLDTVQKKRLASAALRVTRQAYRTAGITNNLALARSLKIAGVPYAIYRHYVFDREGQSCWICQTNIVREELAGRQLYWCRQCQSLQTKKPG